MDQDRADGALAGRFFVFVHPATVIGEGSAGKEFGIVGGRLVDQHEQDFAFEVGTFVVVPVVFGGFDAVAHVNDVGIDIRFGLLSLIVGYVLVERLEVERLPAGGDQREASVGAGREADHGDFLHIGAVFAGGLQAIERELGGNVFGGQVAATLAGAASFEKIVGKEAGLLLDVFRADVLHSVDGGGREVRSSARFRSLDLRGKACHQHQWNS